MSRQPSRIVGRSLGALLVLAAAAGAAGAANSASDLWLHVRVDEANGAKVTVNLPLAILEKAAPMLPKAHLRHFDFDRHDGRRHGRHGRIGHTDMDFEDFRELWNEVRNSPDMTFVTVQEDHETVKVWKEAGNLYVDVTSDDGGEEVHVKVPGQVVDAFLSGEEYDFEAAVQALVDHGQGNIVEVRDRDDHVRVWVDSTAEAATD